MKIFADTAVIEELKEFISWGVVDGCTTNPIIMSRAGNKDYKTQMKEILKLVDGPVSLEVTTNDTEEMITQARELAAMGPNVVVKIPMNVAGLKATAILSKEGIKTNVTACMTTKQAILAAKAGATFVSLFWGRIEDMGHDAYKEVNDTAEILEKHGLPAEIIIGSFRTMGQINQAMMSGAHILTIPSPLLSKMAHHPRTDSTIQEFLDEWERFQGGEK